MKNQHKINRRTFLKLAGGAAVIAGGGFLAQRFDVLGRAAKRLDRIANPRKIEAEFIRQIITRDPSVSRTIMWQSEAAESAAAEEKRPLVVGVGNSNRNIYALDRGDIADMIVINEFNMGYLAVAEAKKKLSSGLREMEQLRVGDTLVARDTMFSAENQKLLFPLVR